MSTILDDYHFTNWVKINYVMISNNYVNAYHNLLNTSNWIKDKQQLMCIYLYKIHLSRKCSIK